VASRATRRRLYRRAPAGKRQGPQAKWSPRPGIRTVMSRRGGRRGEGSVNSAGRPHTRRPPG
jgi:hypothetical protein